MTNVMKLYVVRDQVADESGPIFECKNDAVAQRKFKGMITQNNASPMEYRLFVVGEIDHQSDEIRIYPNPKTIAINFTEVKNGGTGI